MAVIRAHLKGAPEGNFIFVELPDREKDVLLLLGTESLIVPEVVKKQDASVKNKMSLASVYTFINRMAEKGLVCREPSCFVLHGTNSIRVIFASSFDFVEEVKTLKALKK